MDAYDAMLDARSEARYEADLRAEPDTREVAEAMMRGGGAERDAAGMEGPIGPDRCKWCGCFVATGTEPTTRTVKCIVDDILAWRTFTQVLCPPCSASWSTDSAWNRPSVAREGIA